MAIHTLNLAVIFKVISLNARYLQYVCSFFKTMYEWVAKRVCLVLYVVDFSFWMAERPLESKQYVKK